MFCDKICRSIFSWLDFFFFFCQLDTSNSHLGSWLYYYCYSFRSNNIFLLERLKDLLDFCSLKIMIVGWWPMPQEADGQSQSSLHRKHQTSYSYKMRSCLINTYGGKAREQHMPFLEEKQAGLWEFEASLPQSTELLPWQSRPASKKQGKRPWLKCLIKTSYSFPF